MAKLPVDPRTAAQQTRAQFLKFCLVGASSTLVNFAVLALCIDGFGWRSWPHHLGILLGATVAFLVSVTNGFYWNRRWTFAGASSRSAGGQYVSFILVNVVGLLINLAIVKLTLQLVDHTALGVLLPELAGPAIAPRLPKLYPYLAELMAAGVVVFWNFLANRKWTFTS